MDIFFRYYTAFCAIFLLLPWLLGYIHRFFNHELPLILLYFRYVVFFNVVLFSLVVMFQVFLGGQKIALALGWYYSHLFEFYGAAVLSVGFYCFLTMWSRKHIILAIPIVWSVFLTIATILHIIAFFTGVVADPVMLLVFIVHNVVVIVILLGFLIAFRRRFSDIGVIHHGREAYTA